MKLTQPDVLFFAEDDYSFLEKSLDKGTAIKAIEPSTLVEEVKEYSYPVILFDTSHSQFSESLIVRVYRKIPEADFWLLSDTGSYDLPQYLADAVISPKISRSEFDSRLKATLQVRQQLRDYRMVGKSANLKRTAEIIGQVAPTDISTLIIGPSGSGKELVAQALHEQSKRNGKAFIAVNCGALAETLLESELFGYEKGAFTGALGRREGIFKRADGGTVFLDEIGETSAALQVKLLRVLEEGSFYRVGGQGPVHTDIRILAATNRELLDAIAEGDFREDLYFRLGAMRINTTGLTQRTADVMPLINNFFIKESDMVRPVSRRAMELLLNYSWPGNVRQLRNFVNRIIVSGGSGEVSEHQVTQFIEEQGYTERTLPVVTGKTSQEAEFQLIYQALLSLGQEVRMLRDLIMQHLPSRDDTIETEASPDYSAGTLEEMEREMLDRALEETGGNRSEAAKRLGVSLRTLYRKLQKHGDI